jgi:hypothetical protein
MLQEVLRRLPDYRVDRAGAERYDTLGINNGYVRMPASFTPGRRSGVGLPTPLKVTPPT